MRLRTSTLLMITAITLMVIASIHLVAYTLLFPSVTVMETKQCQESAIQVRNAMNYILTNLAGKVHDWSSWDDTYNFAQDGNQSYIDNNLIDSTYANIQVNIIAVVDTNGTPLYFGTYDLENNLKTNNTVSLENTLFSDNSLWNFSSTEDETKGIVIVDNEPILIASKPILTSLGEGPIHGALLFGIFLNDYELNLLTQITSLNVNIIAYEDSEIKNDQQLASNLLSDGQVVTGAEQNSNEIKVYTLVQDIHNNPAFVIELNHSRDLFIQGVSVYNLFLSVIIVLGVIIFISSFVFLERKIIRPLNKIGAYIKKMPMNPEEIERGLKFREEEFQILTNTIKTSMNQRLDTIGEIAGWVGHDLRNPLTGIKGASYYLRKNCSNQLDAKAITMLNTIDSCVEYSNKIVNDLLEYSREIKLDLRPTAPKDLLSKSLEIIKTPNNIQVIDETQASPTLMVDMGKLERVINNLITNSFDAMTNGGQLKISSTLVKDNVEMVFSDTGTGMSEETLSKLWTPFFTTKARGMGFGLPICKRYMEAHGGKLKVESTVGKGTTITLVFQQNKPKS
jgi:signal transduction histidine kinase